MKKSNLKILTFASLLALLVTGCTKPTPTPSTSEAPSISQVESESSTESESTSSSSEKEELNDWSSELKALMTELLGETIPYIALEEETLEYSLNEDETGPYIFIGDYSKTNLISSYGAILEENGYTFFGSDSEAGYLSTFYLKEDIIVQYEYYDLDPEYAGNTIYAWIYEEEQGGSEVEVITDWPAEFKEILLEVVGEVIPVATLEASSIEYYADEDETGPYACIHDTYQANLVEDYGDVLVQAGYEYLGLNDDYADYGYIAYFYAKGDLIIQYAYCGIEGYEGNEVYAWIEPEETPTGSWPTEVEQAIFEYTGTTIPYIQLDEETITTWVSEDPAYLVIYDTYSTDLISGYGAILEAAGYEFVKTSEEWGYLETYYYKDGITICYNYYNTDPGWECNEIYITLDEGYEKPQDILTAWPSDFASDMEACFGEVLPVAPFQASTFDYVYWIEDGLFEGMLADSSDTSFVEAYNQILLDAGYECLGEGMDSYLVAYQKGNIYIEIGYFPGDEEYIAGNELWIMCEVL